MTSVTPLDSIDWGTQVSNSVTVYFAPPGATYDGVTSLGWTQYEIDRAMAAFQAWADVANLTFTITTNPSGATFKLVTTTSDDFLGYFNPPGTFNEGVGVFAVNGDGWNTTGGLEEGGYGFVTLVHEFGHGLGLAHPHDDGGTSTVMTGVSSPFNDYGSFGLNQGVYTIMSYNDGWQTGPSGLSASLNYGWEAGPGALDIAVIQAKYGAVSANTGDNVYNLPTSNAAGTFWDVIYDTGGTDTIAYTGTVTAHIDLTAATLDYSATGGGVISYANGILGGFTIAAGVVIENASGGSGADILIGNSVANVISGGGGNDTIEGRTGNDTLTGNAGNDTFVINSGDGNDTVTDLAAGDVVKISGFGSAQSIVQDGANVVVTLSASQQIVFQNSTVATVQAALQFPAAGPTEGNDTLVGTAGVDTINALGGNDTISGLAGNDTLDGGAGNDIIDGGTGNDVMRGGLGDDTFYVDSRRDVVTELSAAGTDKVFASVAYTLASNVENGELLGTSAISLTGNTLNNDLTGNSGANVMNGSGGNDILNGLGGNDTLIGGSGIDTFQYAAGGGQDTVRDLAVGESVEITGYAGAQSVTQSGSSVIVTLSSSDRITFLNSTVAKVQAALQFESGGNAIDGTSGDDTLNGTESADVINGFDGNDTINGLGGNDTIDGSYGDDTIDGGDGNDTISGGDGRDYIYGGNGDDVIHAGPSDNFLFPEYVWDGAGNDTVYGEGDQDVFHGSLGNDYYDGGTGGAFQPFEGDSIDYSSASAGISVDMRLSSGQVRSLAAGDAANIGVDTLVNIEGVSGSGFGDVMIGGSGGDAFNGLGGDDTLDGGAGNDLLTGGDGTDTFKFAFGGGQDTITDLAAGETVQIDGYDAAQSVVQNGTEVVVSLSATDTITFSNSDVATVQAALEFSGTGGGGGDPVNTITGTSGAETLNGTSGDDAIDGLAGNDKISALDGNDTLNGGAGTDILTGGNGADVFEFEASPGDDRIADFQSGMDKIDLSAFGITASDVSSRLDHGNTILSVDTNHDGTADFTVTLIGVGGVAAGDYIFG